MRGRDRWRQATGWRRAMGVVAVMVVTAPALAAQEARRTSDSAATGALAPEIARAMVVRVNPGSTLVGSGIIVGFDAAALYIATARHVLIDDATGELRKEVTVIFPEPNRDSVTATVGDSTHARLDVAVLRVARRGTPAEGAAIRSLDRLGATRYLVSGDEVRAVGCPRGKCWEAPFKADQLSDVTSESVVFETTSVYGGSSGGALFNRQWEVIGMVVADEQPRARARRIDDVLRLLGGWNYPVRLRAPRLPRAGYRTEAGVTLLSALSGGQSLRDGTRAPSLRVSFVRRRSPTIDWQASALRLAPRDVAVTAALAGAGVRLQYRRLTARPFAEGGLGRVEGRYDAGGVTVVGPDSARYVPRFQSARADGIGFGAGLDLQFLISAHVLAGITTGRWAFGAPDQVKSVPAYYLGGGVRWGF